MKKKDTAKAAKRYLGKGARKILSEKEVIEAKAKLDEEVAKWKAGAAELPVWRAKAERAEREVWRMKADLMEIAACIDAELCKKWPEKAIAQAIELVRAAGKLSGRTSRTKLDMAKIAARINPELCKSKPEEAIKLAAGLEIAIKRSFASEEKAEALNQLAGIRLSYKRGVRLITHEKNWDRALPKFTRFLAAWFTKDGEADTWLSHYRSQGFTGNQLAKLLRGFKAWWKQEKSNRARKSALAKKSRGKVKRPKSDLRFKENRKHKQGYCRKCGKRVRVKGAGSSKDERLCDECLSGKPLLVNVSVDPRARKEDWLLDVIAFDSGQVDTSYKHFGEHLDDEPD